MRSLLVFVCLTTSIWLSAQQVNFSVSVTETISKGNPVTLDITSLGINPSDTAYQLYRVDGNKKISINSQLSNSGRPVLCFIADVDLKTGERNKFRLEAGDWSNNEREIQLKRNADGIQIIKGEQPILHYQTAMKFPPEGIDPIYKKSGFIHPLWSPSGEELTRIQPPDHYHHYGIWGPWTHTHTKDRFLDFWNLGQGLATVQFAKMIAEEEGSVYAGFTALQEHIDFGGKGSDQVAINELLKVNAWNAYPDEERWMIDYTTTINSPLDSGIYFEAYRYGGGLGMRMTEKWHKDNCTVLTSEGHDRLTADGTNARWCIVEGETKAGRSGVLFLSHPGNRAHPEPMRVWPVNSNGRGDMFFEFCPIRHDGWYIQKGKNYSLNYRMVVFDGTMTTEEAEAYWKAFGFLTNSHQSKLKSLIYEAPSIYLHSSYYYNLLGCPGQTNRRASWG